MSSLPFRPYTRAGWRSLGPVTQQLVAARFLRSVAQGALGVDFTLYLRARQWTAPEVGALLMAGGLSGAGLSLIVGLVSDRIGRRIFLLMYEVGLIFATAAVIVWHGPWALIITATVFGFGRGSNGSSGPFAPAEQAWLAQSVAGIKRAAVFSFNAGLQFWGMAVGSLLAGVLPSLGLGLRGADIYLPIFGLNLLMAIVNLIQIMTIHEERQPKRSAREKARPVIATQMRPALAGDDPITRQENKALVFLTAINMLNGLGIGLISPLLPYWFNLRYGVGAGEIGSVYALTFFLTGISSLFVGELAERIGLTRAIVGPRLLGVLFLVAIPLMPTFWGAGLFYLLRSLVNRGSSGARQAFGVSIVRDHRRGLASSLNAVSRNVPSAIGPLVGGWLIGMRVFVVPFAIAATMQLAYVLLLPRLMRQNPEAVRPSDSGRA